MSTPTAISLTQVPAQTNLNFNSTNISTVTRTPHNTPPLPTYPESPPSPPPANTAIRGFSRADLQNIHESSKQISQLSTQPRLGARDAYLIHTNPKHQTDFNQGKEIYKTNDSNTTEGNRNGKEFDDSDSSSSIVDAPSEFDEDDSDDESDNPKMRPKDRADLEAVISGANLYTTVQYKLDWEAAKERESQSTKDNRCGKYSRDLFAGAANQITSFGVAGAAATLTGNPWVFPVVTMLTSDLLGDRLAQVIRRSTIVADGSKAYFENQRRATRALGDLIESCAGRTPKKKFLVSVFDPETQKNIKVKMTAAEALAHTGHCTNISSWGTNLLVRGLPFIWFCLIYGPRDYYINYRCKDTFFPNTTAMHQSNFSIPDGCIDPNVIDEISLRWAFVLIGGMMAGGLTLMTNQLVASLMPHEERINYSPETFKKEVIYKESAKQDAKVYLDWLARRTTAQGEDDEEVRMTQTLIRIYDKELQFARKKASLWTTFQGELDQATQKHRDETVITPEFGGKRLEMFMSMLGKFLTLLTYSYVVSRFNVRASTEEQDKIAGLILIPLSLIFIGGYALRDDARIVGQVPYGLFKGTARAFKRGPDEADNEGVDTNDSQSTSTAVPKAVSSDYAESDDGSNSVPISPGIRPETEKVRSRLNTPAKSTENLDKSQAADGSSSEEDTYGDDSVIV